MLSITDTETGEMFSVSALDGERALDGLHL
jgi:hypothetical protein